MTGRIDRSKRLLDVFSNYNIRVARSDGSPDHTVAESKEISFTVRCFDSGSTTTTVDSTIVDETTCGNNRGSCSVEKFNRESACPSGYGQIGTCDGTTNKNWCCRSSSLLPNCPTSGYSCVTKNFCTLNGGSDQSSAYYCSSGICCKESSATVSAAVTTPCANNGGSCLPTGTSCTQLSGTCDTGKICCKPAITAN